MNNEAFQALVRERSSVNERSSKEIAREAVEEEFKLRKRKRRGGDSSSDEEDNRRPTGDDTKEQRQRHSKGSTGATDQDDAEAGIKYRDRARERREGKILDQQTLEGSKGLTKTIEEHDDDDIQNASEIKGLDVAQARKAKQILTEKSMDRSSKDETHDKTQAPVLLELVENGDQAKQLLERRLKTAFASELGKDMFDFLRETFTKKPSSSLKHRHTSASAAGVAIQQSSLIFSLHGHPHDKVRAWETPLEITQSSATGNKREWNQRLDPALMDRITNALTPKHVPPSSTMPASKEPSNIKDTSSIVNETPTRAAEADEASSDDDIFDEDTKELNEDTTTQVQSNVTKGSIFSGLDVSSDPAADTVEPKAALSSGLLSRIAQQRQEGATSAVPNSANEKRGGVSMSAYGGYYGEEMDVDFDGRFAEDDEGKGGDNDGGDDDTKKKNKNKKKKSWAEDTTLASKEYGAGRSRRKGGK